MSLKSNDYTRQAEFPTTPYQYRYIQRAILKWGNKATGRGDLFCTVLPEGMDIGVPARYLPAVGQVQVPSGAFADVDVDKYAGHREHQSLREFTREHPTVMGKFIHEYGHAGWSPRAAYLEQFRMGNRNSTYQVLMLLMEGHCEIGIYRVINDLEKAALRSTVLHEVLSSLVPDGEEEANFEDPQTAVNLMALIAARAEEGIIDTSEGARGATVVEMAKQALGDFAPRFYALAVRFASLSAKDEYGYPLSYRAGDPMQSVCLEWEELTAEFLQQQQQGGDEQDEPGDEQGEPGDEQGEDGGDESDDESGDDQSGESGKPEQPGDDQGRERVALTDEENTGADGFGSYAGGTSQFDPEALAEALDAIEEGASVSEAAAREEIEIIYREFLHTANERWRQGHRQSVKDAEAVWDSRRRGIWR